MAKLRVSGKQRGRPRKKPKVLAGQEQFIGAPTEDALKQAEAHGGDFPADLTKSKVPWQGGTKALKQDKSVVTQTKGTETVEFDPGEQQPKKVEHDDELVKNYKNYHLWTGMATATPQQYRSVAEFLVNNHKNGGRGVQIQPKERKGKIHVNITGDSKRDVQTRMVSKTVDAYTAFLEVLQRHGLVIYSEVTYGIRHPKANKQKETTRGNRTGSASLSSMLYVLIVANSIPSKKIMQAIKTKTRNADGSVKTTEARSEVSVFLAVLKYFLKKLRNDEKATIHLNNDELKDAANKKIAGHIAARGQLWIAWLHQLNDLIPYLVATTSSEANTWRPAIKGVFRDVFPSSEPSWQGIQTIMRNNEKNDVSLELAARAQSYKVRFAMAPHRQQLMNSQSSKRITKANVAPLDFTEQAVLVAANTMFMSPAWLDKVLLVELAVGARMIEVLKVSDFFLPDMVHVPTEDDPKPKYFHPGMIVQHRIAKDKHTVEVVEGADGWEYVGRTNKDLGDYDVQDNRQMSVRTLDPKPILFKHSPAYIRHLVYKVIRPELVKHLVNNYNYTEATARGMVYSRLDDKEANKQITKIMNPDAVTRTRELFGGSVVAGTHTLRKIYANYSYDTVAEKSVTRNAWIQRVLGHQSDALYTSISYTGVMITRPLPISAAEWPNGSQEMQSQIAAIGQSVNEIQEKQDVQMGTKVLIGGHTFTPIKPKRGQPVQRHEFIWERVLEMHSKGVKISIGNIRKLHVGTESASSFLRAYKDKLDKLRESQKEDKSEDVKVSA